jgi:hypothetical protein
MNQNPYSQNLFYCATSAVIVGTERCRLYLFASNGEQAAKYIWPTKTRKRTRYVVSCERLTGLKYPDEIEAAAHRYGFKDNYPHICDVMEGHKSMASVIVDTNALRWALTFLPREGTRMISIDSKGLSIEGVPLGGYALHDAYMRVHSRSLCLVLEQMPRDTTAHVDILGYRNARALAISIGGTGTHYVFDCYYGFSAFIPTGGER